MAQVSPRDVTPHTTVDYTPSSAVSAGDVVVINNIPYVARVDMAADENGSLAVGGSYKGAPAAQIDGGKSVWWDDTNNQFTETAAGNTHFGFTEPDGGDATLANVVHAPQGVTGAIA